MGPGHRGRREGWASWSWARGRPCGRPDRLQGLDGGSTRLADGPTLRLVALDTRHVAPMVVGGELASASAP